jgi:predicted O-methyltransferase YrrM
MSREQYKFSNDWFDYNIDLWNEKLGDRKSKENHILEVGSFEGASTTWLLDELADDPASTVTAIDAFDTVLSLEESKSDTKPMSDLERRFRGNVEKSPNFSKLRVMRGLSRYVLRSMANDFDGHFNLVYIDGSHRARDVLDDAVMTWPMLEDGGHMIFDDYRWHKYVDEYDNPKLAIDNFMSTYETELDVVHRDFQVIVRKHPREAEAIRYEGKFTRDLDE